MNGKGLECDLMLELIPMLMMMIGWISQQKNKGRTRFSLYENYQIQLSVQSRSP